MMHCCYTWVGFVGTATQFVIHTQKRILYVCRSYPNVLLQSQIVQSQQLKTPPLPTLLTSVLPYHGGIPTFLHLLTSTYRTYMFVLFLNFSSSFYHTFLTAPCFLLIFSPFLVILTVVSLLLLVYMCMCAVYIIYRYLTVLLVLPPVALLPGMAPAAAATSIILICSPG
jgi:hypothetical protein